MTKRALNKEQTNLNFIIIATLCTYLSHYLEEGHLFKIRRLPTHVGACYDHKIASLRDVDVVGDGLCPRNALQDGVATLLYCQCVRELRTH